MRPHLVGYKGQPFMIVVTEYYDGERRSRVIGWCEKPMLSIDLRALETRPGWTNARCEPVVDEKPYGNYGSDPWTPGQG